MIAAAEKTFAAQVRDALAEVYGMRADLIVSRRRVRKVAEARKLGYFLCREYGHMSWPAIGEAWGRDHATVIKGAQRTAWALGHDPRLLARCDQALLLLGCGDVWRNADAPCAGFAAFVIEGRAVDFVPPNKRDGGDICARFGCGLPRAAHQTTAATPRLRRAA